MLFRTGMPPILPVDASLPIVPMMLASRAATGGEGDNCVGASRWMLRRGEFRMAVKRMVLEIGMGTDIRGADSTKAACRALKDALWRNSLSVATAFGAPLGSMRVEVRIGVPRPETVDKAAVLAELPYGAGTVEVIDGGLEIKNDEGTDSTLIAHAAAIVSLDIA